MKKWYTINAFNIIYFSSSSPGFLCILSMVAVNWNHCSYGRQIKLFAWVYLFEIIVRLYKLNKKHIVQIIWTVTCTRVLPVNLHTHLTHRHPHPHATTTIAHPLNKVDAIFADDIFRCIFVNEKFQWSLFLRVQLTTTHHCKSLDNGADYAANHYLNQC